MTKLHYCKGCFLIFFPLIIYILPVIPEGTSSCQGQFARFYCKTADCNFQLTNKFLKRSDIKGMFILSVYPLI